MSKSCVAICYRCGIHPSSYEAYEYSWKMIIVNGKTCDFCGDCISITLSEYCKGVGK